VKKLRELLGEVDLQDVMAFGGLGCACYGLAQIWPPLAWIVGGAAIFWLAVRGS
jgi:hypothetical protein